MTRPRPAHDPAPHNLSPWLAEPGLPVTAHERGHEPGGQIRFGFVDTRFGRGLLAESAYGICWFDLVCQPDSLARLQAIFAGAQFVQDNRHSARLVREVFSGRCADIGLHLCGSAFQLDVWQLLLRIPAGQCTTYGAVAARLGKPQAARAVGSAVGSNNIAVLVPCHRVLPASGGSGAYKWGAAAKLSLLAGPAASAGAAA